MRLTKKQYMGVGYVHAFINDETGEVKYIPCSELDYTRLGEKDGHRLNPILEGFTWHHSEGGTISCDNPDTVLRENEYVDYEDGYFAMFKDEKGRYGQKLSLSEIVNNEVVIEKYVNILR